MKSKLKNITSKLFGREMFEYLNNVRLFIVNYYMDMRLFYLHSTVFNRTDTCNKVECQMILDYHSVEKGLLFEKTKPRFARDRIKRLQDSIELYEKLTKDICNSQYIVTLQILCQYYEIHLSMEVDISDYFNVQRYQLYKSKLGDMYDHSFNGLEIKRNEDFYSHNQSNFFEYSYSRKSIRQFTGEKLPRSLIEQAITLAMNAPSVCNRQASKVHLVEQKERIEQILRIQGGMSGYTDSVSQLLIVTQDRNFFYTVGERNQMYIDGGIFLMNLLYSLHYYKIGCCPANWGKNYKSELALSKHVKIPDSEKIMCIVPIGVAKNEIRTTLSKRRDLSEVFSVLDNN